MLSNRLVRAPLFWCVATCLLLTGLVWLLGERLSEIQLAPDQGASWYYWKLPQPTVWTHLSVWACYAAHQVTAWGLIFYAQHHLRGYVAGLRGINVVALAANLGFIVLHMVQTQVFFDGLAQDVSIYSSQGSVILLLVVVLLMENRRRGLFFGHPVPITVRVTAFLRRYHGYLFSWAAIYTFWYHPMVNTSGHLIGFFYMFLLLVQSSLFFTRSHVNRWWTLTLELAVAVHGTLVAVMSAGPEGLWPMFLFGFLAVFVITQMHGVGLSHRTRTVLGVVYLAAVAGLYSWRGWARLFEVTWIPIIEYALVGVVAFLVWVGIKIVDTARSRAGSADLESQAMSSRST